MYNSCLTFRRSRKSLGLHTKNIFNRSAWSVGEEGRNKTVKDTPAQADIQPTVAATCSREIEFEEVAMSLC